MARFFLIFLGYLLSFLPRLLLAALGHTFGFLLYLLMFRRRRILIGNFSHFCPGANQRQLSHWARISFSRLVEMGLFSLVSPFLSTRFLKKNFIAEGSWNDFFDGAKNQEACLTLMPHTTLSEGLTFAPLVANRNGQWKNIHIVYRPFRNPAIENFIKRTRERFGLSLFSRQAGLFSCIRILKKGGTIGLLFDQDAGVAGTLTLFANRIASSTSFPDLLRKAAPCKVYLAYAQRLGFLRSILKIRPIETDAPLMFATNECLEKMLREDQNFFLDWLWAHNRWKRPREQLLNLNHHKIALEENMKFLGLTALPQEFRVLVQLPPSNQTNLCEWKNFLARLAQSRPDAKITILPQEKICLNLETIAPPGAKTATFRNPLQLRHCYFDLHIAPRKSRLMAFIINSQWKIFYFPKKPLLPQFKPFGLNSLEENEISILE